MVLFRESETLIHFWQHRVVIYSVTFEESADYDEIQQTRRGQDSAKEKGHFCENGLRRDASHS